MTCSRRVRRVRAESRPRPSRAPRSSRVRLYVRPTPPHRRSRRDKGTRPSEGRHVESGTGPFTADLPVLLRAPLGPTHDVPSPDRVPGETRKQQSPQRGPGRRPPPGEDAPPDTLNRSRSIGPEPVIQADLHKVPVDFGIHAIGDSCPNSHSGRASARWADRDRIGVAQAIVQVFGEDRPVGRDFVFGAGADGVTQGRAGCRAMARTPHLRGRCRIGIGPGRRRRRTATSGRPSPRPPVP